MPAERRYAPQLARAGPARGGRPVVPRRHRRPRDRAGAGAVRPAGQARADLEAGASAEDLLWTLWSGTSWPHRLRRSVEAGGGAARRAHRDLDSICALFDVAVRAGERREHLAVAPFLEGLVQQEIPADTLADRGARGAAVRLLTAHRSKGLEWRLVVAAHVQAEGWPDLRRRSTLLQADRIGPSSAGGLVGSVVPPLTARELLMEERRLFYVACTRARERLVVTAVRSSDDEGEQPSRFLDELGSTVEHVVGRPPRPLSLDGLVAELRRTLADPASDPGLREAAARRLARLSASGWDAAPPSPRPTRRPGGARAPRAARPHPSATRSARSRSRPACSMHSRCARPSGSSPVRRAASAVPTSRPTSASWCTRSPSGSRPATRRPTPTP